MRGGATAMAVAVIVRRTLKNKAFGSSSKAYSAKPLNGGRILVSPPLSTVDVPDLWTPISTIQRPSPSIGFNGPNSAIVIKGKPIAEEIKCKIAREVDRMKNCIGKVPKLAVVLVGERRDSHSFVGIKLKACDEVGIESLMVKLPDECKEDEVIDVVSRFNDDPDVHGVLVQLPLPEHLDEEKIVDVVSPEKDVDGFHPINMGSLAMKGREPLFIPCAPRGCIELLLRFGVEITGKKAVVIGRSKIVGLPTSLLLQRHHATVSVVHAFTKKPEETTREADIVISDAGVPNIVRGSWLKPGAVVIDMGTNAVKDPAARNGYRVTGDVCYEEAIGVASTITPVPGGIGPVTISMLLANTLDSARHAYKLT